MSRSSRGFKILSRLEPEPKPNQADVWNHKPSRAWAKPLSEFEAWADIEPNRTKPNRAEPSRAGKALNCFKTVNGKLMLPSGFFSCFRNHDVFSPYCGKHCALLQSASPWYFLLACMNINLDFDYRSGWLNRNRCSQLFRSSYLTWM